MENNKYYEFNIQPKNERKQLFLKNIFTLLQVLFIIVFICCFFIAFFWDNIFWIFTILVGAILFVVIKLKRKFYCFFDVIFIDGDTTIVQVVNNAKRKQIIKFNYKEIVKIGAIGGETYTNYFKTNKSKTVYTVDEYTSNDICILIDNGSKYLILLPYDEKLLMCILRFTSSQKLDKDFIKKIKNS